MLTSNKPFFNKLFSGIGKALAKLPIHPNFLTLLGLVLGMALCAYLLITKDLLLFSILAIPVGLFDMLDGALARASGKSSKFGSYLDAMTDRRTIAERDLDDMIDYTLEQLDNESPRPRQARRRKSWPATGSRRRIGGKKVQEYKSKKVRTL